MLHRPLGPLGMTISGEEAERLWGTEMFVFYGMADTSIGAARIAPVRPQ